MKLKLKTKSNMKNNIFTNGFGKQSKSKQLILVMSRQSYDPETLNPRLDELIALGDNPVLILCSSEVEAMRMGDFYKKRGIRTL